MQIYARYDDLPETARGAALAIGNFDGVHVGHRAVVERAAEAAHRLGAPLAVLMFDPSPRRFFQPDRPPFRLMSLKRRARILKGLGVGLIYAIPFTAEISRMTDREFAEQVLHNGLGARAVAVGFDFRFGAGRMGDASSLGLHGLSLGFETIVTEPVGGNKSTGEGKMSSSAIRDRIREGDVAAAAEGLGDWWVVEGNVADGEKRGRTIGFPTANLHLGDFLAPKHGIYAIWARIEGEEDWRAGVANFGRTPTTGERDPLLEAHLFDFGGDIYGKSLEVAFVDYLRPELKFDSLEALVDAMKGDAAKARDILARTSKPDN